MQIISTPVLQQDEAQAHLRSIEEKISTITFGELDQYIKLLDKWKTVIARLDKLFSQEEIDFLDTIWFIKTPYTYRNQDTGSYYIDQHVASQVEDLSRWSYHEHIFVPEIDTNLNEVVLKEKDLIDELTYLQQRNVLNRLQENIAIFKQTTNWRIVWEDVLNNPNSTNGDIIQRTRLFDTTNWLIMNLRNQEYIETKKEWIGKHREHIATQKWKDYQTFYDNNHEALRAINHDIRRNILYHLLSTDDWLQVNQIETKLLWIEQSVVSQHLRVLREAWLVDDERYDNNRKIVIYTINNKKITQLSDRLEELMKEEDNITTQ